MKHLELHSPDDLGEVHPGDDLAALIAKAVDLQDNDIVVVTSKIVSKAEDLIRSGDREQALDSETVRLVARRGATRIVRTRHGLTLAAAGVDASNVEAGSHILLPRDPDASARRLRIALRELTGVVVGVIITDTAGRPWREGQVDIAIGAAGVHVLDDHDGRMDGYGNALVVTRPAVADELAGAAELAQGKVAGRPVTILRGRPDLVLAADDDGPGAGALVRPEGADLFGYGAREAVIRALAGEPSGQAIFGSPADPDDLAVALRTALHLPDLDLQIAGTHWCTTVAADTSPALRAVCFAHGWRVESAEFTDSGRIHARLRPVSP